jgi:hypothetical protein
MVAGWQQSQLAVAGSRRQVLRDIDRDRVVGVGVEQEVAEPGAESLAEHLVQGRAAQVAVDQHDPTGLHCQDPGEVGGDVALAAARLRTGDQQGVGADLTAVDARFAGPLEREHRRRAQAAERLQRHLAAPARDLAEQLQAEVPRYLLGRGVAVEEEVPEVDRDRPEHEGDDEGEQRVPFGLRGDRRPFRDRPLDDPHRVARVGGPFGDLALQRLDL